MVDRDLVADLRLEVFQSVERKLRSTVLKRFSEAAPLRRFE